MWFESLVSAEDVAQDRSLGINTYVEVTANSDLSLATEAGMSLIVSSDDRRAHGFLVTDEPDMWAGAGSEEWSGNYPGEGQICRLSTARCGFTVVETLLRDAPPGVMTYVNYGKGVAFWHSDAEAAQFLDLVDLVSVDTYWFTDPNICGRSEGGQGPGEGRHLGESRCRLAANYGWTVERARSLVQPRGSKPVWHFVEVGHPFSESWAPTITGPQIRAAVWSGIVHGARGVIYFNHNFGGDCITQHVLRDACGDAVRADVAAVNRQIHQLAPILNAPFVDGLLTTSDGVDAVVKVHDDSFTIIAGSTADGHQLATFDLACTTATAGQVVGEERSVPVAEGRFVDEFRDANAVHIYQLDGGTCGIG
ncbi:hypothetical protein [Ornithinimicrobium kibberense]|uniref:Glycoside hydrolase family 42 N-terminal domain-containing protein n=1 Tax=Ornithinimicrobium kibberense TaxID=282060 RepID=A0ABV5V6H5_9MICO|nr:hypothetical protein [Ornithinimicrobium kibberense]